MLRKVVFSKQIVMYSLQRVSRRPQFGVKRFANSSRSIVCVHGSFCNCSSTRSRKALFGPNLGLQRRSVHVCAALSSSSNLGGDLPEPGTPEAPPQVPPSLGTVPGTAVPVEEIVVSIPAPENPTETSTLIDPVQKQAIAEDVDRALQEDLIENQVPATAGFVTPEQKQAVVNAVNEVLEETALENQLPSVTDESIPTIEQGSAALDPLEKQAIEAVVDQAIAEDVVASIAVGVQQTSEIPSPVSTSPQEYSRPEEAAFQEAWALFDAWMNSNGMYNFEESELGRSEKGVVKKACVDTGRARPEVIYELDKDLLRNYIESFVNVRDASGLGGAALGERKAINAVKRLTPFVNGGKLVGVGEGGAPTFLDVTRLFFATWSDFQRGNVISSIPADFLRYGAAVLANSLRLLEKEASPAAIAKYAEAEQNHAKEHEYISERRRQKDMERGFRNSSLTSDPSRNSRPGDWTCEECNGNNFSRNMQCFRCSAPRPASAGSPGSFQDRSFQDRRRGPQQRSDGGLPPNFKQGDWMCPECNSHNFSSKIECYRCSTPRPEGTLPPQRSNAGRPGDWECDECGKSNFARRTECFACGAEKSANATVIPGNPFSDGGFRGDRERDFSRGGSDFPRERGFPSRGDQGFSRGRDFSQREDRGFARGQGYNQRSNDGSRERRPMEFKAGDWSCPNCNAHNFARRSDCFKCATDKPASAELGEPLFQDQQRPRSANPRFDRAARGPSNLSRESSQQDLEWF